MCHHSDFELEKKGSHSQEQTVAVIVNMYKKEADSIKTTDQSCHELSLTHPLSPLMKQNHRLAFFLPAG